jgi:hypothetical protein
LPRLTGLLAAALTFTVTPFAEETIPRSTKERIQDTPVFTCSDQFTSGNQLTEPG